MSREQDTLTQRGKWNVLTRIEKFDNRASLSEGIPDEVCEIPGNLLLNDGINALWAVFAGKDTITKIVTGEDGVEREVEVNIKPFNSENSYIGVGNFENNPEAGTPLETDLGLRGPLKVYMPMDGKDSDDESLKYPQAGQKQKIVFKSTFYPGVACFKWYEWGIANGNANWKREDERTDYMEQRGGVPTNGFYIWEGEEVMGFPPGTDGWEVVQAALGNNPPPETIPTVGPDSNVNLDYGYGEPTATTPNDIILLNHKQENMGEKYPPSTWIITVEISLV